MDIKLIFLIILLVILGFGVYKLRKRRAWANLLLCGFVILFTLLITEFVYRQFLREREKISTVNNYYKLDTLVGFHFDPGTIKAVAYFDKGDTIYNTAYHILADSNHFGTDYPMRRSFRADSSDKETVFMGCSLTFGDGLADEETLPYQYGELTGTSTVNRACNGMGIHQVYRLFMAEYANQDNNNRVFVYPFFSEHLFRALCLYTWNVAGPWYEMSGDSLIYKGPFYKIKSVSGHRLVQATSFFGTLTCVKDNIERIAEARAKKAIAEDDLLPYYFMLKHMATTVERTGGRFVLLNWDDKLVKTGSAVVNQHISNNKVKQVLDSTHALILQVWSVISRSNAAFFIPNDGHPTALANKKLAEYLAKSLEPLK